LAIGILHVAAALVAAAGVAAVVPLPTIPTISTIPTIPPSFSPQHQAKSVSKRDGDGEKSLIINPMQACNLANIMSIIYLSIFLSIDPSIHLLYLSIDND